MLSYTEEQMIYQQTLQLSRLMVRNFLDCGSGTFPFHCNTQETSLSAMWIPSTFSDFSSRENSSYHSKLTRAPSVVKKLHYLRLLSLHLPALVCWIPPNLKDRKGASDLDTVEVSSYHWKNWNPPEKTTSSFSQVRLTLSDTRFYSLSVLVGLKC